jgi:ABC-2 type transport system permease protein
MINSLQRIYWIAANTFLEAVRQKFFHALLLLSLALLGSSVFFQQFNFGSNELKFLTDFGFAAILFFGSILSIVLSTQLFFNELEDRTALTLLAKPVHKLEFLAGKFFGAYALMFCFTFALSLLLVVLLFWRETILMSQLADGLADGRLIRYGDVFVFGLVQWLKFAVISAMTFFIGSFAQTNLFTIVVSFFALIICQLQYIAREAYVGIEAGLARGLLHLLGWIFPNFQIFNFGEQLVYQVEQPLALSTLAWLATYAGSYSLAFLLLAQLNFRNREL